MVRIKVIRKSQLVSGGLMVLLLAALICGAVYAWQSGLFSGAMAQAAAVMDAPIEEKSISVNASATRAGAVPSADAGAYLPVSAQVAATQNGALYVVDVNLMTAPRASAAATALPSPSPAIDSPSAQTVSSDGAASLEQILSAGLTSTTTVSGDGFIQVNAVKGQLAGKSILIYHTHTHEAYEKQTKDAYVEISAYRTTDEGHSIVRVGDELTRLLESMGAQVYHDITDYEQDSLSTSYNRSLKTLEKFRSDGRDFDLIIDLHRDAYSKDGSGNPFSAAINGTDVARLMVLLGTGEGTSGGDAFSEKPDFESNLKWGQRLTDELNRIAPGICRPVMIKSGRYNQHISERCLLVEVGHNRNTLEQALGSMPYLAQAVSAVLTQTQS